MGQEAKRFSFPICASILPKRAEDGGKEKRFIVLQVELKPFGEIDKMNNAFLMQVLKWRKYVVEMEGFGLPVICLDVSLD